MPKCEECGVELDPERGHVARFCDDECLFYYEECVESVEEEDNEKG